MTAIAHSQTAQAGLRPIDLRRDLGAIARLIEICFGDQLDAGGRSAIREKLVLSRYGPLLGMLGSLLQYAPGWSLGFVWIEAGQLVGNVGVQPAAARRQSWLIANVAVHPEYRRRGIARSLVQAAVDMAAARAGKEVLLQVKADNDGALRLYESLGFETLTTRIVWERRTRQVPGLSARPRKDIRLSSSSDWQAEFDLLSEERPEGLEWAQPLDARRFRPSFSRALGNFINGKREEHWIAGPEDQVHGWMGLRMTFGRFDHISLVIPQSRREELERAMLVRALRRLGRRPWAVRIEHPAEQSPELFKALQFRPLRTLRWLRLPL